MKISVDAGRELWNSYIFKKSRVLREEQNRKPMEGRVFFNFLATALLTAPVKIYDYSPATLTGLQE